MSERKSRTRTQWRRARAHRGDGSPTARAVSPVVATLILILIAVAAAALYLWLVDWQRGITGSIGSQGTEPSLLIGGSTSVYSFDQLAIQQFEQNHSDVLISNSGGGTGAGMIAVCHGQIDIGTAAGAPELPITLQTSDGCPSTATVTTIAYDAVDVVLSTANAPGIVSLNSTELLGIYLATSSSVPLTPMPAYLAADGWTPAGGLTWNKVCTTAGGLASGTPYPGACALSTDAHAITAYGRTDVSGGEQLFTARILGISGTAQVNPVTTQTSALGYTGCGTDGQLPSCGIVVPTETGDSGVISAVAGNPTAIGFASDGLVHATGSGVTAIAFQGIGQNLAVTPSTVGGKTSMIGLGITGTYNGASAARSGYVAWRPFQYVTTGVPTGETQVFINYVLDPENNQNIAGETGELSICNA